MADVEGVSHVNADDMAESSAVTRWQPVFNAPLQLAAVADDVRDTATQLEHFTRLAVGMAVRSEEVPQVIEALQLCERTHGYAAIAVALDIVAGAVESAVTLTGLSLTALAVQRGFAGPGLLIGALVEGCANMPSDKQRFPVSTAEPRLGSPHVEFEDCMAGARAAGVLEQIRAPDLAVVRPYSALVTAFRRHKGMRGLEQVEQLAQEAIHASAPDPVTYFIGLVAQAASDQINLPAQWRRYVRQRASDHGLQTSARDLTSELA